MYCAFIFISIAVHYGVEPASEPSTTTQRQTLLHSSTKATPFMPGVGINWQDKEVEVNARVVLREGMLELFACSRNTREHESIVSINGRASHIFQALGLLGVEPGRPPRWDHEIQRVILASGPRLLLRIRYEKNGKVCVDDIREWMWDDRTDQPAPTLRWVYSGSTWNSSGTLSADEEGTVVSVVDFDSALISVPQSYSANNEELWLRPNPAKIPPVGSACVLLIKVIPSSRRVMQLTRFGRILYEGELMGRLLFARSLAQDLRAVPDLTVELQMDPLALKADVAAITQLACQAGLSPARLTIVRNNDQALEQLDIDGMMVLLKRQNEMPHRMFRGVLKKYEESLQALQALRQFMENHGEALQDRLKRITEAGTKFLEIDKAPQSAD